LALADWVLVATTLAADWTLSDVLRLYRARWQGELVFKRMKQLLRFNQLRSTHRTTVEATIRALLVAWALQDGIVAELRALLPLAPPSGPSRTHPDTPLDGRLVVRTWSLVGLGLETLRTSLPRLRRFLGSRPRRRAHQETAVRAWLAGRNPAWEFLEDKAA
jgi:IS4 transposase